MGEKSGEIIDPQIHAEAEWLVSLDAQRKALFLAALMHGLTIAGRNSYRIQSEELGKPVQFRQINEIQHRVASCLRQVLSGEANEQFQRSIAAWVLAQQDVELQALLSHAWSEAKVKPS